MSRRPLIGITGPDQGGRLFYYTSRWAVQWKGGRVKRLQPSHYEGFEDCAAYIISGGKDINPALYGEASLPSSQQYDVPRDAMERQIIEYALSQGKPILGICRGMQMINVVMGGSLFQEAGEVLENFLPSRSLISKFLGRRDIVVSDHSELISILGGYRRYSVNSIHHQAVNRLGQGLHVVEKQENGLIQAIERAETPEHSFVLGVQWHPELMLHANSARRIFEHIVGLARKNSYSD